MNNDYQTLFHPKSIAIVGVSAKRGTIGNTALRNLAETNFQGKVFGVNPKYQEVEGFPCFPSLLAIEDEIDVVVVAVPSKLVEKTMHECINKEVKFAVIFSSGFAEVGEEGEKLQSRILELCKESGVRILGPNTLGLYNNLNQVIYSFVDINTVKGAPVEGTTLITQSGAMGLTLNRKFSEQNLGLSSMITTGNQLDLNSSDFIDHALQDPSTNLLCLYMESVPDSDRLKKLSLKALKNKKPIIALKAGRSERGRKAALSHTASIAGSHQSFQAVAKQYGIIAVEELEEMMNAVKAFRNPKRPRGKRVVTLVVSGAAGIMLADNVTEAGLEMASLSKETTDRLKEVVPSYCSFANPVDIATTFLTNDILFTHCLKTLVEAEEVDSVIIQLSSANQIGENLAQEVIDVAETTDKPIIVAQLGPESVFKSVLDKYNQAKVPVYFSLREATVAIKQLVEYEEKTSKVHLLEQVQFMLEQTAVTQDSDVIEKNKVATEPVVKQLLNNYDIPVPKHVVVTKKSELDGTFDLQDPLVAKVVSKDITHKSDVGGVVLHIQDRAAMLDAYESIIHNVDQNCPDSHIDGVMFEEMQEGPFQELFVGVKKDPVMGPIILCGLGGIFVEVFKDIAQRPAPITKEDALDMIKELKCYPLLTGIRNTEIYDVEALALALSKISQFSLTLGSEWKEIEINPLIVRPQGKGVVALDGLITFDEPSSTPEKELVSE